MKKQVIYFCSLQSLKHKPLFLHQVHRVLPRCFLEPQDPVPSDICEYGGGGGGGGGPSTGVPDLRSRGPSSSSIVRDQCSRLELMWEIQVQQ